MGLVLGLDVLCPPPCGEFLAEDMECLRGAAGCRSLLVRDKG